MTERLYYHDAYGDRFTGIVVEAWTDDDGRVASNTRGNTC